MIEIEVKAKYTDSHEIKDQIEKLGCVFGPSLQQHDTIYLPQGKTLDTLQPGDNVLRIRTVTDSDGNEKHILTLKQKTSNDLAKHERETNIEDPTQMHDMILMMDYIVSSIVEKRRQKTVYQDMEICLDNVTGLGEFIEVEKIVEEGNADQIQETLFVFLESLGIQRSARVTKGYDVLIHEQKK